MTRSSREAIRLTCLAAVLALVAASWLWADLRQGRLLCNTLLVAAGAGALGLPLGTLLALLLVRTDLPGRRVLAVALGVLLLIPLYLQAAAWDAGFGQLGWYSAASDTVAWPLLRGWRAVIWIHGLAAVPWVALIVGAGLRQVDPEWEEQALLDGSPTAVLWRVTGPRIRGTIGVAGLWVVLSTATEMTVTDLYRVRTYAEELYTGFELGDDWGAVALTVLPGMIAQVALILGAAALVASVVRPRRATGREPLVLDLGRWRVHAWLLAMGLLVLIAGVPLGNLVYKAGLIVEQVGATRWRHWSAACLAEVLARGTTEYRSEFQWTVVISGLAATLAVVMGAILGWLARRGGRRAWPALMTAAVGLAVPGPLLGLAVLWLRNQEQSSGLVWLYDRTVAAPVLTATVRCLPLAILISWTAWRTLADEVLDAAACDGAGAWSRFWRIAVPQRWLALGAAWLAAFAVSAGDLATSILVVPPGMTTVPIRVFGLIHAGVDQQVAALCLLAAAGYAVLAGLVVVLLASMRPGFASAP